MRSRCTACDEHANFKFSANGSNRKLGIRLFPLSRNRSSHSPLAPSSTVNNKTNPQCWQKLGRSWDAFCVCICISVGCRDVKESGSYKFRIPLTPAGGLLHKYTTLRVLGKEKEHQGKNTETKQEKTHTFKPLKFILFTPAELQSCLVKI